MSEYKVGDKVLDITNEPIEKIMEIKKITSDRLVIEGWNCRVSFHLKKGWGISRYVRLATPKEIEQGFRDE